MSAHTHIHTHRHDVFLGFYSQFPCLLIKQSRTALSLSLAHTLVHTHTHLATLPSSVTFMPRSRPLSIHHRRLCRSRLITIAYCPHSSRLEEVSHFGALASSLPLHNNMLMALSFTAVLLGYVNTSQSNAYSICNLNLVT